MFLLKEPSEETIKLFLSSQRGENFSYPEVGITLNGAPRGYIVDHNRVNLGQGLDVFTRAVDALRSWKMFDLGWIKLFQPDTPIEIGATVGVLAYHFGFWSLNACRIVYIIDEAGPVRRYGFAYGTLPGHAERGEERFTIEWHQGDDSVWYDIFAFSRPNHFLSKLGYPLARILQKRFARDSKRVIFEAASTSGKELL